MHPIRRPRALHEAGPGTSAYRIGGDEFALIVHDRRAVDTLYLSSTCRPT